MQNVIEQKVILEGLKGKVLRSVISNEHDNDVELHFDNAIIVVNLEDLYITLPEIVENESDKWNIP